MLTPPPGTAATNPLRTASAEKGLPLLPPPPSSNIGSLTSPKITSELDIRATVETPGSVVGEDGKAGISNSQQGEIESDAVADDETRNGKEGVEAKDEDDDFGDFQAA